MTRIGNRGAIVEREDPLARIADVVAATRAGGRGRLVLVTGEAGAGKTTVVRELVASAPPGVEVLVGSCDNLRTPRPAGPLLDWALQRGIPVPEGRQELFHAALEILRDPAVTVLEDAHWADEATLDLLLFLGRRIQTTQAVLLVTYRADEVGKHHPLAAVLAELATSKPVRVAIEPLSVEAVGQLADGTGVDPVALHQRTGGNAFFVTECLGSGGDLPDSLRAAVVARADLLSERGRAALELVSVAPARMDLWLAERLGAPSGGIDECVARGLLLGGNDAVRFRHELAREAIHDALGPAERRALHRAMAEALVEPPGGGVDHARVVHHAVAGGADELVLRHAPLAAASAARAGARREAVAHLEAAVARSASLTVDARRDLWAELAEQRAALGDHDAAIEAYDRAISLAAEAGDDQGRGELLARMWTPLSMSGRVDRAGDVAAAATEVLERLPEGRGLALARAQRCAQHMLARQLDLAEPWGRAAIELAERLGAHDTLAYALIQSGVALWMGGSTEGLERLRRGVDLAAEHGFTALVAQGLSQIGSGGGEVRHYADAVPALEACLAHADAHELGSRGTYARAWLGRCRLELGSWDDAGGLLTEVLRSPRCDGISRITALTALGRLRVRRGDPDGRGLLEEASQLAAATGHLQRTWPAAVATAEAAWFEDRLDDEVGHLQRTFATASELGHRWAMGETAFWLWRAGTPATATSPAATTPFHMHVGGDPHGAARIWEGLGCPYEQASALADSDVDDDQLEALRIFQDLGARPAAQRVLAILASAGRRVPRGPNAVTRANPGGLTDRELDVLSLVAAGCTNSDIADRLSVSPKTVGHHVSHILTKFGVRSRAAAVTAAMESGVRLSGDPTGQR